MTSLPDHLPIPDLTLPSATSPAPRRRADRAPRQRSFDDLGTPLHEVTFCVIDLETTGGSPQDCFITEVGAVKVRGGECLGTYQTMVNPGAAIPPEITVLTGITQAMVYPAPRIESVLPTLLEFVGDAVIVGHNIRFDVSFLQAALRRSDRPPLGQRTIDTCALARRLLRDEVPNCKLGTLASYLRLDHQPSHRALDDALATTDLLHLLLERAGGLGVTGLDDLLALPTLAGHAQASKLRLTTSLPRRPGVYLFRDRNGRVLYVGKATDLRARVRSYFSSDTRRKVAQLLRETHTIDHQVCPTTLEAAVREVRLIHEHLPRFNRQAKDWQRYAYLKLTLNEAFPRLSVVKVAKDDGALYLGPLPSTRFARRVAEAIETSVPLRRCSGRPGRADGRSARSGPCTAAQLGVATCPCTGEITPLAYAAVVERAVRGLRDDPAILLEPLAARMTALAGEHRFEEATDVRDRAAALTHALARQRRIEQLVGAGRVVVEVPGPPRDEQPPDRLELRDGRLTRSWAAGTDDAAVLPFAADEASAPSPSADPAPTLLGRPFPAPLPRELADEISCIAAWLDGQTSRFELVSTDEPLASPLPRLPSFEPRKSPHRRPAERG